MATKRGNKSQLKTYAIKIRDVDGVIKTYKFKALNEKALIKQVYSKFNHVYNPRTGNCYMIVDYKEI